MGHCDPHGASFFAGLILKDFKGKTETLCGISRGQGRHTEYNGIQKQQVWWWCSSLTIPSTPEPWLQVPKGTGTCGSATSARGEQSSDEGCHNLSKVPWLVTVLRQR